MDDGREETTVTDLSTVKVAGGKRPVWRDEDDEALRLVVTNCVFQTIMLSHNSFT